jgi:hypothetical protein
MLNISYTEVDAGLVMKRHVDSGRQQNHTLQLKMKDGNLMERNCRRHGHIM